MLDDLRDYLQAQGIGTVGTDLFSTYEPDQPDNCVTVIQRPGQAPDPYLPTFEPSFQVLIRNADYTVGRAKADAVRAALHQQRNFEQGTTHFYFVLLTGEGGDIGRDPAGRECFSFNFRCRTRPV